ncbi:hypothetical protein K1719_010206 [Acacia pycnantha]|nr:hypothetical protein K1719_010206 [Acacia pycnantha]
MAANDAGIVIRAVPVPYLATVGKKGRGPTQMKGLTARRVRGPVRIEFDDDLNPIGPDEDRMDILATSIGKPDHPGQVRGEPRGVGLSRYFGRASPHSRPSEELVAKVRQELTQSITEEVKQQLQLQQLDQSLHFDQRLEEMAELHRQEMAEQRRLMAEQRHYFESMLSSRLDGLDKGNREPPSLPSIGNPTPQPSNEEPCKLLLDDPTRVVAYAVLHTQGTNIHGKEIPVNTCRVSVRRVRMGEEKTCEPFPDGKIEQLEDAINGFIL